MSGINKNPSSEEQKKQFFAKAVSSFLPNDLACSIFDMKGFKLGRENSTFMKEGHYSKPEYVKNNDVSLIRNKSTNKSQENNKSKFKVNYIDLRQSKFGMLLQDIKNFFAKLNSFILFGNFDKTKLKIKKYLKVIKNNINKVTFFSNIKDSYILNANNPVDALVKIDIMNLLVKEADFQIKDYTHALEDQSRLKRIKEKQKKVILKAQMHLILLNKEIQSILFVPAILVVETVGILPISIYFASKYVGLIVSRFLAIATGTLTIDGDNELKDKIEQLPERYFDRLKTTGYRLYNLINIPFNIIYANIDLKNDINAALSLYDSYLKQQRINDRLVITEYRENRELAENTPVRYLDRKAKENTEVKNNIQHFHYSNTGFTNVADNSNKTRVISKKRPRPSSNERH